MIGIQQIRRDRRPGAVAGQTYRVRLQRRQPVSNNQSLPRLDGPTTLVRRIRNYTFRPRRTLDRT